MGANDLLTLARTIDRRKNEARDLEAVARAGLEVKAITPSELRGHYSQIEKCSEILNRCDTAMAGLGAVVELVALGVIDAEEL